MDRHVAWFLEDEHFLLMDLQGKDSYYTNDNLKCPDSVRFAEKEKYPNKVMVWVAISSRGTSKPVFHSSMSWTVFSGIYMNKCLLPFIREHHPDSNYS